jgi:hypothetical protein
MCLSIAIERPDDVLAKGEHLGFEWMVIHNGSGYRCGYARVPLGHPWHGKGYDDLNVDVHGDLTFAEADVPCDAPGPDTDWWLGFDCVHLGDAPDLSLPIDESSLRLRPWPGDVVRTQEYVEAECRSLCQQAFNDYQKYKLVPQ